MILKVIGKRVPGIQMNFLPLAIEKFHPYRPRQKYPALAVSSMNFSRLFQAKAATPV